ncbi:MAG: tRNA-dependent cyclodipeptide synthase [Kofleriaceae bacterium]
MTDEATARKPSHESTSSGPATRYRAKIDAVSPPARRMSFEREHEECFLGVSLENSNFVRPKLRAILEWIARRFPRCTVLIGDSIHRITLETTRDMGAAEARAEALRLGRAFLLEEEEVFKEFQDNTTFSFVTCGEIQAGPAYPAYFERLQRLFRDDPAFRASVERFGKSYHNKHSQDLTPEDRDYRIHRSSQYFLEEFAIFSCLRDRGLGVMVYPGSFSTLAEIAAGDFPAAPAALRDLVVVSLHMRGR